MNALRWGIIGTGDVAERKSGPALYLATRSELFGVTNRNTAKAQSFAMRHGNPKVFETVADMLSCDDIDAVYIATPPDSHCELTVQCAEAGKHILCEKPMAFTPRECETMISACDDNSVSLSIAYYRRYFPVVEKIKQLLDAGVIGKPLRVSTTTVSQFRSNSSEPWRLDKEIAGGGFLMDVGTHRFDLMASLFGRPTKVQAIVGTQQLHTDVEDAASVCMEFANHVQATASFQWNCPIARDTFEVIGTQGILWTDSLSNEGRLWLQTKNETEQNETEQWELPADSPVHLRLVERFVDHVLSGSPNPIDGESGSLATVISNQCYDSIQ